MKSFFLSIALLASLCASAQSETTTYKYAVKGSLQTSFIGQPATIPGTNIYNAQSVFGYDILQPTIAFQLKAANQNRHEIELSTLSISENESTAFGEFTYQYAHVEATRIAVRYEYIFNLLKKNARIKPYIGLAAQPYYEQYFFVPTYSIRSSSVDKHLGIRSYVVPHISYNISNRVFIDFNMPFCIFNAQSLKLTTQDPALQSSNRNRTYNFIDMLPSVFSARLGVGVRL